MSADESRTFPVVREEEELLRDIRRRLLERPQAAGASEAETAEELRRLQEDIAHAKTEDKAAMLQQFDNLTALLGQIREGRRGEGPDPDSPYFAHMRLQEGPDKRDLFLGRATRVERGLRIVDWRSAPIARIFYRYQEGEEFAEEMGGRLREGVLAARRTLSIRLGQIDQISSPQGTFQRTESGSWRLDVQPEPRLAGGAGQSLLTHDGGSAAGRSLGADLESLRRRSDKHLPHIAALLDAEQFDLISRPESGLVVIRGIAGSGKTTVALHRVAWLAFQDPKRFRPDSMAVVVWGRAMRDYISKVLPSLGVEGVPVHTWTEWARELVRRHLPMLPRRYADDTPEVVSRLKLHPALPEVLEAQVRRGTNSPNARGVIDDFMAIFRDRERLFSALRDAPPRGFTDAELERAALWLDRQREALQAWIDGARDDQAQLDDEDDALFLRIWQLRVGELKQRSRAKLAYSHLVVDEVQDLSPIEVRVLLDVVDEGHSITLAGDTQQHILEDSGFASWDAFFERTGLAGTTVSTLRVSYRSTHEITSFARAILGPLAEDDTPPITTRPGAPVELFRFTDHGNCVAFLADVLRQLAMDEPLASVGVITPTAYLSDIYFDGLSRADVPRLRRVVDQGFAFAPGVEVTETTEVKGLEFDYVVLVEVSSRHYGDDSHARRLLHVGATRAAHQLWLTCVDTPSPLLSALSGVRL